MLYSHGVQRVHLELTNKCNAACPLCPRKSLPPTKFTEVTLQNFKLFFPKKFLETLTDFNFCGNFGEPTLCRDIIPIHQYIHDINPRIRFNISTNGAAGSLEFWQELGEFYASIKETKSSVKFCIDGLEDTNHLYRVNVPWPALYNHFTIFNSTGALSEWSFIPFKHNQHEFEKIRLLYKLWGFSSLHVRHCRKVSPKDAHMFTYQKNGRPFTIHPTDDPFFLSFQRTVSNASQSDRCIARQKREIYVDCFGNVFPCCWYGTIRPENVEPRFSLFHNSISKILKNSFFDHEVTDTWNQPDSKCNSCCWSLCKEYY